MAQVLNDLAKHGPLLRENRYNTFYVLYPLGISSEMWLVHKSIDPASKRNPLFRYILWAVLAIYVPGMTPSTDLAIIPKNQLITYQLTRFIRSVYAHDGTAATSSKRKAEG